MSICISKVQESLPCGNFSIVILWWCFQNISGNSVTRVVGKTEDLWVYQGMLDEGKLAFYMFPRPVYKIYWKHFHAQTPLNVINHTVNSFAVTNLKSRMIQFVSYFLEIQTQVQFFKNINQNLYIPCVCLCSCHFIFSITTDSTSRSRDAL